MSDVIERFEIEQDADEAAEIAELGPWVRYEDHAALLRKEKEEREKVEKQEST